MPKDNLFEAYQTLRAQAEKEVEAAILEWAMSGAADHLKIGEIRDLRRVVVKQMNLHTRQVFELRRSAPEAA